MKPAGSTMICRRFAIYIVVLLFFEETQGCRPKCQGGKGVPKSVRPFFTECLSKKLAGVSVRWKILVDYVVWDDTWYYATDTFFCREKGLECWLDNLKYLIKPNSYKYPHVKNCIVKYMTPKGSSTRCENVEPPVYRPPIYQKFEPMLGCPGSETNYVQCLSNTAFLQTAVIITKPGTEMFKPSYKIGQLVRFLNKHRSECKITQIRTEYIRSCSQSDIGLQNRTSTRSKRATNLKKIISQASGGRINFRLSSNGIINILPSKPIVMKAINAPQCLSQKLAMVMRSKTVLYNVVSNCNAEENKGRSRQVSTMFRVHVTKPKKLAGQVGTCKDSQWTVWFNIDNPQSGTGDLEYLNRIRRGNRTAVCMRPTAIQAKLVKNNTAYTESGETVKIGIRFGLSCHNYKQGDAQCEDYKVRFCCKKL